MGQDRIAQSNVQIGRQRAVGSDGADARRAGRPRRLCARRFIVGISPTDVTTLVGVSLVVMGAVLSAQAEPVDLATVSRRR